MMRSDRRVSFIGLAGILMLSVALVACGGGATPAPVQEEAPPAEEAAPPPAEEQAPPPPAEEQAPPPPPEGEAAPPAGQAEQPSPPPPESAASDSCVETHPHPIGQSIADTYETATYDQVMAWFCAGSTFDDILLALETNAQTNVPTEDLLAMRAAGTEWDQIWQDIGLTEPSG